MLVNEESLPHSNLPIIDERPPVIQDLSSQQYQSDPPQINIQKVPSFEVERNSQQGSRNDIKGDDIKKSFNSAFSKFTKFTDKVGERVKKDILEITEDMDDWDNVSMKSGASSDDEDFVVLKLQNDEEVPAFAKSIGVVPEADIDRSPSIDSSNTSDKSSREMSLIVLEVRNAELSVCVQGKNTSLALTADYLIPSSLGNIMYDKYQSVVPSESNASHEFRDLSEPTIKLRYEQGPDIERKVPTAAEFGFLRAVMQDLDLTLATSSLTNLIDFIEDEVIPANMPIVLQVSNCKLQLENDLPATYPTSPGAVPVDLTVSDTNVWRGQDGVFHVSSGYPPFDVDLVPLAHGAVSHDKVFTTSKMQHVMEENIRLQKQVAQLMQVTESSKIKLNSEENRMVELEKENYFLSQQLEKIGKLESSHPSGHTKQTHSDSVHKELEYLRQKAHLFDLAQEESSSLSAQLVEKQDEVLTLKQERESLLATLQLLQDELNQSENLRNRSNPSSP